VKLGGAQYPANSRQQFAEDLSPIGGMKVGNASSELTDSVEQVARLIAQPHQQEGSSKVMKITHWIGIFPHDLLRNAATGGVGVDRMIMILLDQSSIRDITPFPMSLSLEKVEATCG